MAIQTRGQITLIATPDYRLQVSPQVITVPVNEDDSLLGGGSFSQEITINALDSLNNNLKFIFTRFKPFNSVFASSTFLHLPSIYGISSNGVIFLKPSE